MPSSLHERTLLSQLFKFNLGVTQAYPIIIRSLSGNIYFDSKLLFLSEYCFIGIIMIYSVIWIH